MSESTRLDQTFQIIMKRMMETGQAPHFTEIASELDVAPKEGRNALHGLFPPGFPAWLFPNTDYICSFPPFGNLPTQYRITIDGQQKWIISSFSLNIHQTSNFAMKGGAPCEKTSNLKPMTV